MNEWQMQPLRTNPSGRGAKVTMLSVLFCLATLPGAGVRGRTGGLTKGVAALGSGGGR